MTYANFTFKISLQEVALHVRHVTISTDLYLYINERIIKETEKLPLTIVETHTHTYYMTYGTP